MNIFNCSSLRISRFLEDTCENESTDAPRGWDPARRPSRLPLARTEECMAILEGKRKEGRSGEGEREGGGRKREREAEETQTMREERARDREQPQRAASAACPLTALAAPPRR